MVRKQALKLKLNDFHSILCLSETKGVDIKMKKSVLFVVFLFCAIMFVCPSAVRAEVFGD